MAFETKIVLIAHSMGGLVAKKAYILAREDPSAKELASRIHTLYFLATPHRGSDLTKILMNIMKVSFGQKAFVGELDRNSASIDSINDSFRHHAEDLQLWSFYETVPSSLILTSTLIVDKASATLGYAKERTSLLNADHRGVCKFDLPGDPNYKTLRNAFVTTIDAILSEISQAISETSKLQHNQLVDLTGITEPPVNDLVALEDLRADGSCGWLMSKQIYSSWRTPWSDSRAIFWLTGNAGSGKSVLCSQIINDLQKQNLRCSYFFFKHGSGVESTIAGCLRALAYQLAKSDEAVLRKVLHIEKDALPCTQWDERTLWRKLFVGCIFKVSKPLPQYWVIDGLDECPKFSTFVSLTAKAPSCLRMFFTSCTTPEAEKSLVSLGSLVEHYQMQGQDTLDDLGIFIDSRMNRLPAGDEQGQMKLRNKLLEKSSGSFLWVSLIVQELEQAYSEEVAEEVLDEVPEDMNRLYARMLENLPQNERAMRLAKAIFMWTLFSFWALTVSEMQCAVKLDSNQTVHNLGRSISAICGQLLGVDQSNRVHSIHQTTQVFLLQQDIVPSLAMDRQESHTRIAQSCLKLLANNNFAQATRLHKTNGALALAPDLKLVEYACVYFSDHLQKCSSDDQTAWDLLCKFLDSNVPSWIESLSVKGRLYHITRTAKNLQSYLRRRLKHMNPLSAGKETLESWITDMIKLSVKFRTSLIISPSSIHTLIPPLCPSGSIVSKMQNSRQRGFSIKGLRNKTWDDCLVRIDYSATQASAVALGDRYLAVATSDGTIFIYYRDSIQIRSTFSFGERAKILMFSSDCLQIAVSGLKTVRMWDTESNIQLWAFDTSHQALSLLFTNDNTSLIAATQGGYTTVWDLQQGLETEHWQWKESIHETGGQIRPHRAPGKVLVSPSTDTLAVCYRGLPIISSILSSNLSSDVVAETPVMFQLASAINGCTLVSGRSRGSIQIFEFGGSEGEKLLPIHRIDAYEDGIRSIAFGSDSLRFADIRVSQCRVWEPVVLVRSEVGDGSQSEISQAVTLVPKSVGMLEGPQDPEITAVCHDHSGGFVFCGKEDGAVVCFETQNATQLGILYRHAVNVRISSIAYSEQGRILVSADESGRVLVNTISPSENTSDMITALSEIRSQESITALMLDPAGARMLVQGNKYAHVWTIAGEKVGSPITTTDDDGTHDILIHLSKTESFIIIGSQDTRTYSWTDGREMHPPSRDTFGTTSFEVTPPSPIHPQ
ncbi:MAG: hypothetical protein Q9179_005678, partial [Wetmoreana sp. 5 TL-2023]